MPQSNRKRPIEQMERELGELPTDEALARDIGERLLEELDWRINVHPVDEAEKLLGEWAAVPGRYPPSISDREMQMRLEALRGDRTGDVLVCRQARSMPNAGTAEAAARELTGIFRRRADDRKLTGWIYSDESSVRVYWAFHETALTPGLLLDFAQAEAALRRSRVD